MNIKSINVQRTIVINTGNFESKRIGIELSAELDNGDNYNIAFNSLSAMAEEKLNEEYNKVKGTATENYNSDNDYNLPSPTQYPPRATAKKSFDPTDDSLNISCPKCGAPMVLKNGKTGPFWGCSAYFKTHCNGLININQVEQYLNNGTLQKNRFGGRNI